MSGAIWVLCFVAGAGLIVAQVLVERWARPHRERTISRLQGLEQEARRLNESARKQQEEMKKIAEEESRKAAGSAKADGSQPVPVGRLMDPREMRGSWSSSFELNPLAAGLRDALIFAEIEALASEVQSRAGRSGVLAIVAFCDIKSLNTFVTIPRLANPVAQQVLLQRAWGGIMAAARRGEEG